MGLLAKSIICGLVSVVAMDDVAVADVAVDEKEIFCHACFLGGGQDTPELGAAHLDMVELMFVRMFVNCIQEVSDELWKRMQRIFLFL